MDTPFLQLDGLTKRFGGLTALAEVSFSIARGEIHAVVGENGAGKSTLMKILAGSLPPDAGRILLEGRPLLLRNPRDARRQGIGIVYQELNIFPHLTVAANLFINEERTNRLGLLDERGMARASMELLTSIGVDLAPERRARGLSLAERQLVEIARSLRQEPTVLILDEPNSALNAAETERLFATLRRLRFKGITILYVSHRLEEVFALCDRITILRDGRCQGTWRIGETSIPQTITCMVGMPMEDAFPTPLPAAANAPVLLEVADLEAPTRLGPLSLEVRAGEIVGLAGLEGSGVDGLYRILFGLARPAAGAIRGQNGRPVALTSPRAAVRQGWGLIPASRREQGLFLSWPVRSNGTIRILDRLRRRWGLLDRRKERQEASEMVERFSIATDSLEKPILHLSGGNQQKVVLARWLAAGPQLLLLNDPTRGVDVAAKAEIYRLVVSLAARGMGILWTSSEIEETLGLCHRVIVLNRGKVAGVFQRGQARKADLLTAMSLGEAAAS